jgi:type-F conjugative transfer system secretin TraK
MEAQVKKLLTNSCLVLSLFISTQALAKQEKTVEDGEEFTAEISKTDINRIKLYGDRIRSVQSNEGELVVTRDDKLGEMYIRVTSHMENRPLNLFIVTEQNFTYKALLYPKSIPAEQIIIRNDAVVASSDAEVAKVTKSSYETQIIALMKAMRLKRKLDGYTIKQERHYIDLGDIGMRRVSTYKGQNFIGEIFVLKNSTSRIIPLEEKMFFKNGVRAIKIEKENLLPDETTEIFVVS